MQNYTVNFLIPSSCIFVYVFHKEFHHYKYPYSTLQHKQNTKTANMEAASVWELWRWARFLGGLIIVFFVVEINTSHVWSTCIIPYMRTKPCFPNLIFFTSALHQSSQRWIFGKGIYETNKTKMFYWCYLFIGMDLNLDSQHFSFPSEFSPAKILWFLASSNGRGSSWNGNV